MQSIAVESARGSGLSIPNFDISLVRTKYGHLKFFVQFHCEIFTYREKINDLPTREQIYDLLSSYRNHPVKGFERKKISNGNMHYSHLCISFKV